MRTLDPSRADQILEVAGQLFAQRRYHEVRMEDIALQAGVAKGTIYRYFEHKEDLYLGLILTGSERLYEELQAAIAEVDDPENKVFIYIERTIAFFRRYPYFFDLVQRIEVSSGAENLARLQAARNKFFDFVAELLADLQDTGRYLVKDPRLAALALTGMTRQVLRFYPQPWPKTLAATLTRQFLQGLAT